MPGCVGRAKPLVLPHNSAEQGVFLYIYRRRRMNPTVYAPATV
ncbi:hypothetical protein HMPREF1861_00716 [Corynebacterium kroppenstedtii]|nr:hypothetical protein HMPREF1861_00716 [Corynebacterium kroppenstedtii]